MIIYAYQSRKLTTSINIQQNSCRQLFQLQKQYHVKFCCIFDLMLSFLKFCFNHLLIIHAFVI